MSLLWDTFRTHSMCRTIIARKKGQPRTGDRLQHTCHRFPSRDRVSMTSFPPRLWYQPRYKVRIKITSRNKNSELIGKHFNRRYRHKNQMPISSKTDAINFYEKCEWITAPELCIGEGCEKSLYFIFYKTFYFKVKHVRNWYDVAGLCPVPNLILNRKSNWIFSRLESF